MNIRFPRGPQGTQRGAKAESPIFWGKKGTQLFQFWARFLLRQRPWQNLTAMNCDLCFRAPPNNPPLTTMPRLYPSTHFLYSIWDAFGVTIMAGSLDSTASIQNQSSNNKRNLLDISFLKDVLPQTAPNSPHCDSQFSFFLHVQTSYCKLL